MKLQIKFSELNKQFRSIRNEVEYQNRVTRSCTNRVINSLTHLLSTFSSATYWFLEQTVVDQRQCRHSIVFSTNELFSNSNKSDGIYFCGGVNKKHINNVVKLMTSHLKCVLLFWVYKHICFQRTFSGNKIHYSCHKNDDHREKYDYFYWNIKTDWILKLKKSIRLKCVLSKAGNNCFHGMLSSTEHTRICWWNGLFWVVSYDLQ